MFKVPRGRPQHVRLPPGADSYRESNPFEAWLRTAPVAESPAGRDMIVTSFIARPLPLYLPTSLQRNTRRNYCKSVFKLNSPLRGQILMGTGYQFRYSSLWTSCHFQSAPVSKFWILKAISWSHFWPGGECLHHQLLHCLMLLLRTARHIFCLCSEEQHI